MSAADAARSVLGTSERSSGRGFVLSFARASLWTTKKALRSLRGFTIHLHRENSYPLHIRHGPEQMRDMEKPDIQVSFTVSHVESIEVDGVANGVEIAGATRRSRPPDMAYSLSPSDVPSGDDS